MSAEEGHLVWRATAFVDWDDGEGATTAGFPIDRDIFGIGLRRVSVDIRGVACEAKLTLIRLVSHAFLEMRRLS
jgi:hypothetical protein